MTGKRGKRLPATGSLTEGAESYYYCMREISHTQIRGGFEMSGIRNLWAEVRSGDSEGRRKTVESGGRIVYSLFILIGGLLAFDLYTRPDAQIVKFFGGAAAILLTLSDMFWAWATHHSAEGGQRNTAYAFWGLGIAIFALNVMSEYEHYLNLEMNNITYYWYWYASVITVVVAAVGWALYLMQSPEQKINDVTAKAKGTAVKALLRGIETPDDVTSAAMNAQVVQASHELAGYAGSVVMGHVANLTSHNGNGTKTLGVDVPAPENLDPNPKPPRP